MISVFLMLIDKTLKLLGLICLVSFWILDLSKVLWVSLELFDLTPKNLLILLTGLIACQLVDHIFDFLQIIIILLITLKVLANLIIDHQNFLAECIFVFDKSLKWLIDFVIIETEKYIAFFIQAFLVLFRGIRILLWRFE